MEHAESQVVISKQPCDDCKSSDAKAYYDDGHTYCYSCNTYHRGNNMNTEVKLMPRGTEVELENMKQRWMNAKPVSIPDRALKSGTVAHYGVLVTDTKHYYPYFKDNDSVPCGFKIRTVENKGFAVLGDIKGTGLFGQQKFGNARRKTVIVTEGEVDAMAAYQMLEGKFHVVSIRGGAAHAGQNFKEAYDYLDGYEEIILCFDADDAGNAGIEKAAEVFAGKLKIIKLDPRLGKDAADYLTAGRTKEFVDATWSASPYTPKGVLSSADLWEILNQEEPDSLGDYPWAPLNRMTYGFRPTELITITAGSGLGKSSILREIVMHLKQTTSNRIGCLFMEESVKRTAEGFMSVDLSQPIHLPTATVKRGSDEYADSFKRTFGDDQIMIMDASFDTGATVDQVVSRVRYMAKALDCKIIILDHISILVSGGQYGDERKALDEIMTKLRTLTQDTGIVLFAVSHLKRPDGKGHEDGAVTSVSQLRGSASIAQLSDFVIGLERNGQSDDATERNTTHIRVLKNRFSGITGPAGHLLYHNDTGRLTEYVPIEEEGDSEYL